MRSLGLDLGERHTGVAVSDPHGMIAFPLTVIEHRDDEQVLSRVLQMCDERGVSRLVVGMPYLMDGQEGSQAAWARALTDKLRARTGRVVELWDERLSTWSAERALREAGPRRRTKDRVHPDAVAAAYILQSYLDHLHSGEDAEEEQAVSEHQDDAPNI
ncbi:MAG: Holliday junction resolvase RuvX [Chloroflexota bacterium]